MSGNNRVAIVGVGFSDVARDTGLTYRALAAQSAVAAMNDAGMQASDIDGVTLCALGEPEPTGESVESAISPELAGTMLGIGMNWFSQPPSNFGNLALESIAAVSAGLCHTCIAIHPCRTMSRGPGGGSPSRRGGSVARGDSQFTAPFGPPGPGVLAGLNMQRHMALYGTKEEHFGQMAVDKRYHASMNEDALFRDPITMQDYLESRWISKPVHLLDCDYPCDMSAAVIFTTEERARDWEKEPVFVESSMMSCMNNDASMVDMVAGVAADPGAREMWSRTDLKPKDVSCAMLYDGFSVLTLLWLEALGFCKPGESGPFVAEGNTRLGGKLPLNTDGGVANVGRRHGGSHLIEAVRQLRGECGPRQVKDAKVSMFTVAGPVWRGFAALMATE